MHTPFVGNPPVHIVSLAKNSFSLEMIISKIFRPQQRRSFVNNSPSRDINTCYKKLLLAADILSTQKSHYLQDV